MFNTHKQKTPLSERNCLALAVIISNLKFKIKDEKDCPVSPSQLFSEFLSCWLVLFAPVFTSQHNKITRYFMSGNRKQFSSGQMGEDH